MVDKVVRGAAAADVENVAQVSQPAVSPISNRRRVQSLKADWNSRRPQAGSTATQQVGKPALRLCQRPCPYWQARMSAASLTVLYDEKDGQMSRVFWLKNKRNKYPLSPVRRRRGVRGHSQVVSIVSGGQWPTIRPVPKTSSGSDLVRLEASIAAFGHLAWAAPRLCLCAEDRTPAAWMSKNSCERSFAAKRPA